MKASTRQREALNINIESNRQKKLGHGKGGKKETDTKTEHGEKKSKTFQTITCIIPHTITY